MDVSLLTIGTELLKGRIVNTNARFLSARLYAAGFGVNEVRVVGDDRATIVRAISELFRATEIIIASGGLGPTRDDVTKPAACDWAGCRLVTDPQLSESLRALFRRMGYPDIPARSVGQAEVPEGALVLPNPRGTASGLLLEREGKLLFLLPGVPPELEGLLEEQVLPYLTRRFAPARMASRIVRTVGVGESVIAERIEEALSEEERSLLYYYPHGGAVDVVISAPLGGAAAAPPVERVADHVAATLRECCFTRDERGLPEVIGELLTGRGATLAAAESCTGGLLGKQLTEAPGASRFFLGAVVCYSNRLKEKLLEVPAALLERHGAVSEPVARAMAEGALRVTGASHALAVTGIAGPEGGAPDKPVGTVCIALAGPEGVSVRSLRLAGDRAQVRHRAAVKALEILWHSLRAAG